MRPQLNKTKIRQDFIFDELVKNSGLSFSQMFTRYSEKFSNSENFSNFSEKTFSLDWKKANSRFEQHRQTLNQLKSDEIIKTEIESIKQGIKTKKERVLILQVQVDDILEKLNNGMWENFKFQNGKKQKFERSLSPKEIVQYNRLIKDLQAEISKIEGDYKTPKDEEEDCKNLTREEIIEKLEELGIFMEE